jgi:uncharacterized membrane protein YbhN (UPF0104 family)
MATLRPVVPALRTGAGVAVLGVLVVHLGAAPFVQALDRLTVPAIVTAVATSAVTTLCCAWRWSWTAGRLGLDLEVRPAFLAYYRSQFLNLSLPGGILGDVHRALRHGADTATVPRAARAVAWDRALGQAALIATAGIAMVWLPSAGRTALLLAVAALVTVAALLSIWLLGSARRGRQVPATVLAELRRLASGGVWLPLSLSLVAVLGHLLVLMTATRTAGVAVPVSGAVPLLVTVLLGSSLPLNVAGWGPREGTAAWLFGVAGLGAANGVTVAALYGVLTFIGLLPGAVLVIVDLLPRGLRWRHA